MIGPLQLVDLLNEMSTSDSRVFEVKIFLNEDLIEDLINRYDHLRKVGYNDETLDLSLFDYI